MNQKSAVPELTFTGVTVINSTKVFVPAVIDEWAENDNTHSLVLRWADGQWSQTPVAGAVISSCFVNDPALVNVCATGEVKLLLAKGTADEIIDRSDDGRHDLVTLRCARTIANKVYAAGMARRVYCRTSSGRWEAIDKDVFVSRDLRTQSTGFLAIDGFGMNDIFAAGYQGEIWHQDGNTWSQQKSPTNVTLTSLRCGSDGVVYIAGLDGTLIRGRLGAWETLKHNVTQEDFWSVSIFQGRPYFATDRALFTLHGDVLRRIDTGLGKITTRHLDCDSEVLWSVGSKHLAVTRDGVKWESVPGPV